MSEAYRQCHRNSGFKPGDIVTITHKVNSRQAGWENNWSDEMDELVGKSGVIIDDTSKGAGFLIDIEEINYRFPYFVLIKAEPKTKIPDKKLWVVCPNIAKDKEKKDLIYSLVKKHEVFSQFKYDGYYDGHYHFYILQNYQGVNYVGFTEYLPPDTSGAIKYCELIDEQELFEILGHKIKLQPLFLSVNVSLELEEIG